MNDTCYFTFDLKKLDPEPYPQILPPNQTPRPHHTIASTTTTTTTATTTTTTTTTSITTTTTTTTTTYYYYYYYYDYYYFYYYYYYYYSYYSLPTTTTTTTATVRSCVRTIPESYPNHTRTIPEPCRSTQGGQSQASSVGRARAGKA